MIVASEKSIFLCAYYINQVACSLLRLVHQAQQVTFTCKEMVPLSNQLNLHLLELERLTKKITQRPITLLQSEINKEIQLLQLLATELKAVINIKTLDAINRKDKEYSDAQYFSTVKKACTSKNTILEQKSSVKTPSATSYLQTAGRWRQAAPLPVKKRKPPASESYIWFRI